MRKSLQAHALVASLAGVGLGMQSGIAGTIRHDTADGSYTSLAAGSDYAPVGKVFFSKNGSNYMGSGTMLTSQWVLTAGHVVYDSSSTVTVTGFNLPSYGLTLGATQWVANPNYRGSTTNGYDIGLIKLATPVDLATTGIVPASRYTRIDETGKVATMVGYGATGTGLTGATLAAGTKRAGQNVVDAFGGASYVTAYSNRLMFVDFDQPGGGSSLWSSSTPQTLEYLSAPGDSGGALFFSVGGQTRLAGVTSIGVAPLDSDPNSSYGDAAGYVRVSQLNSWIDDTITVRWSSGSSGTFSSGAAWSSGAAPGANDVAGFNVSGTYTVHFSGATVNERALLRSGTSTWDLGAGSYTLTSLTNEGSLIVGKYSGNTASLTIVNGEVRSKQGVVGELAGSSGTVIIGSGGTWRSAGTLYVGQSGIGSGGTGLVRVDVGGALVASAPLAVSATGTVQTTGGSLTGTSITNDGVLNFSSGSVDVGGIEGTGTTTVGSVSTTATLTADYVRQNQLTIYANSVVTIRQNGTAAATSVLGTLSLLSTGKLDLTDNDLVVKSGSVATVKNQISTGYAGGAWSGTGLTSSTLRSDVVSNGSTLRGLGYAQAEQLLTWNGSSATFSGQTLSAGNVAVKFTWNGDTNLDGAVDLDNDFSNFVDGYNGAGTNWFNGDFNHDGVVDLDNDFSMFVDGYNGQGAPLDALVAAILSFEMPAEQQAAFLSVVNDVAAVPEPASLGLLALGAAGLLIRRRK